MVALYSVWCNFVRVHKTLRVSPAMAKKVSDRLWNMKNVAEMIDAACVKSAAKRRPYKKKVAA